MAKYEYKPMNVKEFSRNLDDTGLSLSQFCRLTGEDYDVAMSWLAKENPKPIPHRVRAYFLLMALPSGSALLRQMTDAVIVQNDEYVEEKAKYGYGKQAGAIQIARNR